MSVDVRLIADALDISVQAVHKRALRESWPFTEATCRGGRKRLFDAASLPAEVQRALAIHEARQSVEIATSTPSNLPAPAAQVPAETRALVAAVREDATDVHVGMLVSMDEGDARRRSEEAMRRYRMIEPLLSFPPRAKGRREKAEVLAEAHGVSTPTLYRWEKQYRQGGITALMDKVRTDRGQARTLISQKWETMAAGSGIRREKLAEIAEEMSLAVRGLWAQANTSVRQVQNLAKPVLYRLSVAAGMPEAVAKRCCNVPRKFVEAERRYSMIATYKRDAKKFYDTHQTPIYRTRENYAPGDVVFGDVSPCDIPVLRPDGKLAWARLIVWQDAATNMIHVTGYLPNKGTGVRREHVALSFASMCAHSPWGMPKRLYLDNGSEYSWTEMLDAWRELAVFSGGVFGGVQLNSDEGRIIRSQPFKPRAKNLEGIFSALAWHLGWHPLYAGGNRIVKRTRRLGKAPEATPLEDLKQFFADAIPYYHATPQGGDHMKGRSPVQVLSEWTERGWRKMVADEGALMLAFSDRSERVVTAGTVSAGGWRYYHEKLHQYDGEKLLVRHPRHDPVCSYVFKESRLLCVARPMPVYDMADPQGAKYAGKLAQEARKAVQIMKGEVAWLEPRELMREFAELAGVREAIEATDIGAGRISVVDPEVQALCDNRHKAAEQTLAIAAKSQDAEKLSLNRWGVKEDPAVEALRAQGW
ncbi:Transposase-like Mu [Alkalidesulfovibrio alkalitolerans DSM 16529]|uniref:Transposase-like Mu n=1 Tax=Alkalidesulfovibrio alkalitolerans DSM 16529 TaxID=1121439 RepID=S7TFQ2_9BACT|nr:Mu transposase C-terminal domain-containing protein [Alkalidesulfovibrio alkalitolerans]EPR35571.1 Transposase-like Mu [Alkalidesulfovibrio alkalitolerans DSM 16529]